MPRFPQVARIIAGRDLARDLLEVGAAAGTHSVISPRLCQHLRHCPSPEAEPALGGPADDRMGTTGTTEGVARAGFGMPEPLAGAR